METLIAILIAGAVMAYVGYPLLKPRESEEEAVGPEDSPLQEVFSQKESTLSAIAELDFDRAMGNLSEQDYVELRDKYKIKALALLKKQDELSQIEDKAPAETIVLPEAARTKRTKVSCTSCGAALRAGDKFCASCGAPVKEGCPNCGANYGPGDAFCVSCGAPVVTPFEEGCPNCGADYAPGDAFCANCGHRLTAKGPNGKRRRTK